MLSEQYKLLPALRDVNGISYFSIDWYLGIIKVAIAKSGNLFKGVEDNESDIFWGSFEDLILPRLFLSLSPSHRKIFGFMWIVSRHRYIIIMSQLLLLA